MKKAVLLTLAMGFLAASAQAQSATAVSEKAWSWIQRDPNPKPVPLEQTVPVRKEAPQSPLAMVSIPNNPDVAVTTATNTTQSENSVFVSPTNPQIILNSNNSSDWPVTTIFGASYWVSTNGGSTWTGSTAGAGGTNKGDPATAIDLSGRMYVGYISSTGGMGISYSTNNGATWTPRTVSSKGGLDKEHVWVDNGASSPYSGRLYDAWSDFLGGDVNVNDIEFSRSTDGGVTWSAAQNISDAINAGSHNQGVNLQTGPNGELYATWAVYDAFPANEVALGFAKSLDGGVTWSTATRIRTINGTRNTALGGSKTMRHASFPSMAVNQQTGKIYIVWANIGVPGTGTGDFEVYLIGSTNGGSTWSTPVRVNQDASGNGKDQWMPWLACDPVSGDLSCIFYDSRNFVNNDACEAFVAVSQDHGATWTDARVSDSSWSGDGIVGFSNNYAGDYLGISARGGKVVPCWSDNHTGNMLAYVSPFTISDPPPVLTSPMGGQVWAAGSQQTVTWTGGGAVKIELFADVTASGSSLTGPSVVLQANAPASPATVTLPADFASTRARIQISRLVNGVMAYSYSTSSLSIYTAPAAGVWSYAAVDAANRGYTQSDMCYNGTGGVAAVYFDLPNADLRYNARVDKTVAWGTAAAIATTGAVGSWPSIARGSDGRLHVAYYDHTVGSAKLYYNVRSAAGVWGTPVLVANITVVQGDCSIVLNRQGVPMIAYDTGNAASQRLAVVKQQTNGTWAAFGATITAATFPHHITLRADANNDYFWVAYLDQSATPLNVWKYNGTQWVQIASGYQAAGPYTDLSLALDAAQNPQLAYTVPGTATGGQKLLFQPWAQAGGGFAAAAIVDDSPGTISSVDLEYGPQYPRIGYVGNGVAKLAVGVYSPTQYPVAWTHEVVEASGNMDTQMSLVVNPTNDEKWLMYRDLGTSSVRAASPAYVAPVLTAPAGGVTWAPGSQQTVQWTGTGPVKIQLFADVTATGSSLTGPVILLSAAAAGNSALVTLPADIATTRARIQISPDFDAAGYYNYNSTPFKIVTPPAGGLWNYSAVDAPTHGYSQSDMCYNNGGGVDAVYFDLTTEDLRYAGMADKTSPWVPTVVASTGTVGSWPSIARGADGRLHVAYYDHGIGSAKLYYNVRSAAGVWGTPVLVANITVVQGDCSIVLDRQGVPMIAYDTGNAASQRLAVVKQQANGTWAAFGATITTATFPHHITLRADANNDYFWVCYLDQSATPLNVWKYNGVQWVQMPSGYQAAGPYTDLAMALDQTQNPQLAYTVPGTATGGQKLLFQPWAQAGGGFATPVTIDDSPGTISSVDMEYGSLYPRIAYVGNGVAKLAVGVYSNTQWPVAWTREIVDATGNMDTQVSLAINPSNDERWLTYRDLGTTSLRAATPYYLDTPPAAVTDMILATGFSTGAVSWTAPGADGNVGQAAAYDLRWNTSPVTESNFSSSNIVPTGQPQPAGSPECYEMSLQSCTHYWFAVKTRDAMGNWSAISNSPGSLTDCSGGRQVVCGLLGPNGPPSEKPQLPLTLHVGDMMPNPARSNAALQLAIPAGLADAEIELSIFDVAGRRIRVLNAGKADPGITEVAWDLRDAGGQRAANGVYFVRVRIGSVIENRRVLLIK